MGLFQTRAEALKQIQSTTMDEGMKLASLPTEKQLVATSHQIGNALGRAIGGAFGWEPPEIAKARAGEELMARINQSGVSLAKDPEAFYTKVLEEMGQNPMFANEAFAVSDKLSEIQSSKAKANVERAKLGLAFNRDAREQAKADLEIANNDPEYIRKKRDLDLKFQEARIQAQRTLSQLHRARAANVGKTGKPGKVTNPGFPSKAQVDMTAGLLAGIPGFAEHVEGLDPNLLSSAYITIASRAKAYQASEKDNGRVVSFEEAVNIVAKNWVDENPTMDNPKASWLPWNDEPKRIIGRGSVTGSSEVSPSPGPAWTYNPETDGLYRN